MSRVQFCSYIFLKIFKLISDSTLGRTIHNATATQSSNRRIVRNFGNTEIFGRFLIDYLLQHNFIESNMTHDLHGERAYAQL